MSPSASGYKGVAARVHNTQNIMPSTLYTRFIYGCPAFWVCYYHLISLCADNKRRRVLRVCVTSAFTRPIGCICGGYFSNESRENAKRNDETCRRDDSSQKETPAEPECYVPHAVCLLSMVKVTWGLGPLLTVCYYITLSFKLYAPRMCVCVCVCSL